MSEEKKPEAVSAEVTPAEDTDGQKKKIPRRKKILKWTGFTLLGLFIVLIMIS